VRSRRTVRRGGEDRFWGGSSGVARSTMARRRRNTFGGAS